MSDFKPIGIPMSYIPQLNPDYRSDEDRERVNQMFDALRKEHNPVYEEDLAKRKEELLKYIEERGLSIGEFFDKLQQQIVESSERQILRNRYKWLLDSHPKWTITDYNIKMEHINTEHHESDN